MTQVERWAHPRDAARDAVVWGLVEEAAKKRKEEAKAFTADYLVRESSKGVDAHAADGTLIGSVTRSKPSKTLDVDDMGAFLGWVVQHRPDLLSVQYEAKKSILKTLRVIDGVVLDPDGVEVPGVCERMTSGSVRVNKESGARELVRDILDGVERVAALPQPEPEDRYTQDRRGRRDCESVGVVRRRYR
ncbi:hypothetical protein NIIDNTM18_42730 [Mycolicibacterium litorale]|uniref:Uncharacterized protein n=1 Tax=Mycolicibacterium litorale TaxID=758802 RepID=A0A6S6P8Z8_9MYCO|nr:hypothetical protein [Mycolicibacterium litorale]BCI54995.1 hypothetical protein NIIDNTM18_42730 [Mycolicibacterium litorale]